MYKGFKLIHWYLRFIACIPCCLDFRALLVRTLIHTPAQSWVNIDFIDGCGICPTCSWKSPGVETTLPLRSMCSSA